MKNSSKSEWTEDQELNQKIFNFFCLGLAIVLVLVYIVYKLIGPASSDVFIERLYAEGYEVFDAKEEYRTEEEIVQVLYAGSESLHIYFFEINSNDYIDSMMENNLYNFREIGAERTLQESTGKQQKYYLQTEDTFFALVRNEDILIYVEADLAERDEVKGLIKDIMPHGLVLTMVLIIMGSFFIFLPIAFGFQEKRKGRRCNVRTIGIVLDNKKILTSDKKGTYSYLPILSYYANAEKIISKYENGLPRPMPRAAKIEIKYNNKRPEEFCFVDQKIEKPFRILIIVFIIIGIFLSGLGLLRLLRVI